MGKLIHYKKESDIEHIGGNGYLMAATRAYAFLHAAIDLADGILEYDINANIILFTELEFIEKFPKTLDYFTYVVVGCPSNERTKMWGMARTPWDVTAYLDVDLEVRHKDILDIFDNLKDDKDIAFTVIREYSGAQVNCYNKEYWDKHSTKFLSNGITRGMHYHGGMCVYRKTDIMIKFMNNWYFHYWAQRSRAYVKSDIFKERYCNNVNMWDQFTLWRMLNETDYFDYKYKINVGIFEDDGRWNENYLFRDGEYEGELVLYHYTVTPNLRKSSASTEPSTKPSTEDNIDLEKFDYYG